MREIRRRWREKNREHIREYMRRYTAKPEVREHRRRWKRENPDYYRHPKKAKARILANHKVPLGDRCEVCGTTENLERHHPNYDEPLNVMTVCHRCNMRLSYS
jgi:hypothetical protein